MMLSQNVVHFFRIIFTIVILFLLNYEAEGQQLKSDNFFKDDFVYQSKAYKIRVGKLNGEYAFDIIKEDTVRFTQVSISQPNVFESNLSMALDSLVKSSGSKKPEFKPTQLELFKTLYKKVVTDENDTFDLSDMQALRFKSIMDSLSKKGLCQEFYNHDSIQHILIKTKSESLRNRLQSGMISCQSSEIKPPEFDKTSAVDNLVDRLYLRLFF